MRKTWLPFWLSLHDELRDSFPVVHFLLAVLAVLGHALHQTETRSFLRTTHVLMLYHAGAGDVALALFRCFCYTILTSYPCNIVSCMSSVTIIIVSFLYVLYVVLMESRSGFSGTAMPVILSTSLRMWAYLSAGVFMIGTHANAYLRSDN